MNLDARFGVNGDTAVVAGAVGVLTVVVVIISSVLYGISVSNEAVTVQNDMRILQQKYTTTLDQGWKKVSEKNKISDKYAEVFEEIVLGNAEKRNVQILLGGETDARVDTKLYQQVMNSVEEVRSDLKVVNDAYLQKCSVQYSLHMTFPDRLFVSGEPIECRPIMGKKAKGVLDSGTDDVEFLSEGR